MISKRRPERRAAKPRAKALSAKDRTIEARKSRSPLDANQALEGSVNSLRRLLSEMLEARNEGLVAKLVKLRSEASAPSPDMRRLVAGLDVLLAELGATRFEALPLDAMDPLIHVVLSEKHLPNVPAGTVVETVRPGFRTARGLVVAKAGVTINRRA